MGDFDLAAHFVIGGIFQSHALPYLPIDQMARSNRGVYYYQISTPKNEPEWF
jgi:hypothetical protein